MINPRILAIVMAGGEGKRLYPLTAERSKPAVPFGGRYRIVDFVLSNLVNSGIHSIYLLVQYKSQSLIEHVRRAWVMSPLLSGHFVTVVPPQMREGPHWFQGTADAVAQNLNLIDEHRPDLVAVFGADHIYRMNIKQMAQFHLEREADVTVAALPVPVNEATAFGVIDAEADGRIREFREKPAEPPSIPGDPEHAYASMGNYIFSTDVLCRALEESSNYKGYDFGGDVLPRLKDTHRVYAYNYGTNRIRGLKPYEDPAYWRDVGTVEAFYEAHFDFLGEEPKVDAFNKEWPLYSSHYPGPSAKLVSGEVNNSILGSGSIIKGAKVHNSILRREVTIEEGAEVDGCIIMDYVTIRRGAKLRRAIVDRFNVIEAGDTVGYDVEADRRRWPVSATGIVVVPKGRHMPRY
ncbi:glucose-1-phosphate adenylyltransferase [Ectothiorhodospiraceae bacterium 2226]|nr:glucose-1-phosphate adenylyltransferase [Ectothiorhodospiraceae bacterium 2226]